MCALWSSFQARVTAEASSTSFGYLVDRIPVRRPGQPTDLEGPIVFLASDASEYITGQTLLADGGMSTGAVRALPRK
jgi:gluconate 5-dehydrogenase